MMTIRIFKVLMVLLYLPLIVGCVTVITVKPDVTTNNIDLVLYGNIDYEGNWSYVPRTISNKTNSPSNLSFKYAYDVKYGGTSIHQDLVTAFIPTTILGTPTGVNDVQVVAKLDVFDNASPVKSYTAACNLTNPRGIFFGGINMTELRLKGLMAVKENIEMQMVQDREFLLSLTNNTRKGDTP